MFNPILENWARFDKKEVKIPEIWLLFLAFTRLVQPKPSRFPP